MPAASMEGCVTNLQVNEVIPDAGHWLQQEAPHVVTEYLLAWLAPIHGR